jgi:hypothetical protein
MDMRKTILGTVVCLGAAFASAQQLTSLKVNLPVAAKVGNVNLPAGAYSIRELSTTVIEISSDNKSGVKTLATVMPIVAPDQKTSDSTKVVLRQEKSGLQVDKIWLEGQDMGFELNTAAGE